MSSLVDNAMAFREFVRDLEQHAVIKLVPEMRKSLYI